MTDVKRNKYDGLDFMKLICSVMVVIIHTVPFAEFSYMFSFMWANMLCRVAVPLYFICSGFLFCEKISSLPKNERRSYLLAYERRLLLLYAFWIVIYFPMFIRGFVNNVYTFSPLMVGWGTWLSKFLPYFLQSLFVRGINFHLWYLPALMFATALVYALLPLGKKVLLIIGGIFYVFGLLGDSYWIVTEAFPKLAELYGTYEYFFVDTRNGLFFGVLFVGIGAALSDASFRERLRCGKLTAIILYIVLLLESLLVKEVLWGGFLSKGPNMYITLVPLCAVLFVIFSRMSFEGRGFNGALVRNVSMVIYFCHGIMLAYWYVIADYLFLPHTPTVAFVLVLVSSALMAYNLVLIRQHSRFFAKLFKYMV